MNESQLQKTCFMWVNSQFPLLRNLVFHIPNEGKRSKILGAQLKSIGLVSGVPDLCFAVPCNGYGALYIEMKHGKGTTSPQQDKIISNLLRAGNAVYVCDSFEKFKEIVYTYFSGSGWLDKN